MPGRSTRRVYFEDELVGSEIPAPRRTRGSSSRPRSRSAERVHSIFDENITTSTTTTTAAAAPFTAADTMAGRVTYDQLIRENQYLRIELRETARDKDELERANKELERANRELRRRSATGAVGSASDAAAGGDKSERKEVSKLRKKLDKLEDEVADVRAKLSEWRKKAGEWKDMFEQTNRRYEDVNRRLETTRKNYGLLETENLVLGKENASLRRRLEIEERLNGGGGSPGSSRHARYY